MKKKDENLVYKMIRIVFDNNLNSYFRNYERNKISETIDINKSFTLNTIFC